MHLELESFPTDGLAVVVGASGSIGAALREALVQTRALSKWLDFLAASTVLT